MIRVTPNTTYYVCIPSTASNGSIRFYDKNQNYLGSSIAIPLPRNTTVTMPNDAYHIHINFGTNYGATYSNNISLNYPSTDTQYHAYHKTTDLSENLPQTVYGGSLDLNSGVLTVDRAIVDLGSLNYSYDTNYSYPDFATTVLLMKTGNASIICSAYDDISPSSDYAFGNNASDGIINVNSNTYNTLRIRDNRYSDATTFKTAVQGVQLCYELATPFTIQLTPTELTLLKDYAYVSTNGTRIDLDYRNGEMATLEDVLDAQNKLQEEIDNPISYDGKNYRLGMDATGLYLYNITDDTKAYIQMVTP